jgi:hypothetical protein
VREGTARQPEHSSSVVEQAGSGGYDDIAIDGSEVILYLYGLDADALWAAVAPAPPRQSV